MMMTMAPSSSPTLFLSCVMLIVQTWTASSYSTMALPPQVATTSRLQVHIPQSMARRYPHQVAMFGMESLIHGRSLVESLYFLDNDLCSWESVENNRDNLQFYPSFQNRTLGEPFLVMIRRGGDCTFVQKVRNAQHLGAAGVLIADNVCLCQDKACVHDSKSNGENTFVCQQKEPVMVDDGSGYDISIPSFLIDKSTADFFIGHLKQPIVQQPMRVEMAFIASPPSPADSSSKPNSSKNIVKSNSKVRYDLWTQPTIPDNMDSVAVRDFWSNLKVLAQALPEAHFTPHMVLYDGVEAGCHETPHVFDYDVDEDMPCYNLCTNRGRYCAADPDGDMHSGLSGQDVVRESLRRVCIWSVYGINNKDSNNNNNSSVKFFDYAVEFQRQCYSDKNPLYFRNEVCVNQVYKTVGIEGTKVRQCMKDSGGLEYNQPNTMLDTELATLAHKGVYVVPTLQVMTTPAIDNDESDDEEDNNNNNNNNHNISRSNVHHPNWAPPNAATTYRSLQGTGITPQSIFTALCQSWGGSDGNAPAVCQACMKCTTHIMNCLGGATCTATGRSSGDGSSRWARSGINGISVLTFLSSVMSLTILAVVSAVGHRHYRRHQMREHVQTLLAEYNYTPLGSETTTTTTTTHGYRHPQQQDHGGSESSTSSSSVSVEEQEEMALDQDSSLGFGAV